MDSLAVSPFEHLCAFSLILTVHVLFWLNYIVAVFCFMFCVCFSYAHWVLVLLPKFIALMFEPRWLRGALPRLDPSSLQQKTHGLFGANAKTHNHTLSIRSYEWLKGYQAFGFPQEELVQGAGPRGVIRRGFPWSRGMIPFHIVENFWMHLVIQTPGM